MTYIFTGSCFPQQHGNNGRYRHQFQEPLKCAPTTNTFKKVFININGYPNWIIEQTIKKVKNKNEITWSTQVTSSTEENEHLLMLPYKGKVGETTLKNLQNSLKSVIPANNLSKIIYTGTKLPSKLNIKDKISKENKHDLIYKAHCHDLNCDETYIGEIGRRFFRKQYGPLWP